jgi:hypothetical protein
MFFEQRKVQFPKKKKEILLLKILDQRPISPIIVMKKK